MRRLSVVIVTYNSREEIDACLQSLTAADAMQSEIVVVDNASPDGTAAYLRRARPELRVIDAGANLGFARANNLGLRRTTGELVLLLNPDTVVHPGALERLVASLDRRPDAAAAGPRLVDGQGRAELSFGRMMAPGTELWQKALVRGQARRLSVVLAWVERLTRQARDVDWVSGACLLVRRDDAEAVGLFDERYFMYCEDVDFCAALRGHGRAVIFEPSAVVTHLRGRSTTPASGTARRAFRRSRLVFYEKHHPRWLPVLRALYRLRGDG